MLGVGTAQERSDGMDQEARLDLPSYVPTGFNIWVGSKPFLQNCCLNFSLRQQRIRSFIGIFPPLIACLMSTAMHSDDWWM